MGGGPDGTGNHDRLRTSGLLTCIAANGEQHAKAPAAVEQRSMSIGKPVADHLTLVRIAIAEEPAKVQCGWAIGFENNLGAGPNQPRGIGETGIQWCAPVARLRGAVCNFDGEIAILQRLSAA